MTPKRSLEGFRVLFQGPNGDKQRALGCPQYIPWSLIEQHERQALLNHCDQSLDTLAQRGGLSPVELYAVLQNKRWREVMETTSEVAVTYLLERVASEAPKR